MTIRGGPAWRYAAPLVDQFRRPINYLRISVTTAATYAASTARPKRAHHCRRQAVVTSFWMLPRATIVPSENYIRAYL